MKTVFFADLKVGNFAHYKGTDYQVIGILKDLKNFPGMPDFPEHTYIIQFDKVYANGSNWISGTKHSAIEILDEAIAHIAKDPTNA